MCFRASSVSRQQQQQQSCSCFPLHHLPPAAVSRIHRLMQLRNDDAHRELLPIRDCHPQQLAEHQILMSAHPPDATPERESLSPQSTYTTETGNQLLYRLKSSGYRGKLSWSSDSAQLPPQDATTLTSNQKFSMKQIAIFPPRVKRRVVLKNGTINVNKENVERRHQRYLQVSILIEFFCNCSPNSSL